MLKLNKGDVIVYATGKRVKIKSFPDINGEPGVMISDPAAMFPEQTFKTRVDVENMIKLKIWRIEK